MVTVIMLLAQNHDVISYDNYILDVTKTLVQLALENITCQSGTKWYYSKPKSPKLSVENVRNEEASSSSWCQYPFLQLQAVIMYVSVSKWAISSLVLKWYGSLTIALFKFVGFKQILSLRLPDLSMPSTRTKLVIHGVASCTGFSTPTCNILSTSCLKASFSWTGIGWQGVCFGVTLGSSCIWYGAPGNQPIPLKTSG